MDGIDVTVIGGGIVGCATAAELAGRGLGVVLLEKAERLATGVTARNSEVAHGGMYYPTGTLKARHCVRGRRMLKEFCARAGVDYRECGKLIVAVAPGEEPELERLLALGETNGVEDLRLLDTAEVRALEPNIRAVAALSSPRTGILDVEGAAHAYAHLAAERGAQVLTGAEVTRLERRDGTWRVTVGGGLREGWTHASRLVVNAAGLSSDRIAALAGLDTAALDLDLHWVKGNYFTIAPVRSGLVSRLVYPVPPADGTSLGIHVCVDLAGQLRLGPDVEHLGRREDYTVDEGRREDFFRGASRFLPWLERDDLAPGMAGIRPKLTDHGFSDFAVRREEGDLEGLVDLIGIDSPGLTSAPALAVTVADLVTDQAGPEQPDGRREGP